MMSTSGKFTLAAFTVMTASPGPARGDGTSSTTSDSGGPNCLHTTAFTNFSSYERVLECSHEPTHFAPLPGLAVRRKSPRDAGLQGRRMEVGAHSDDDAQARCGRPYGWVSAHADPADRRRRLLRY